MIVENSQDDIVFDIPGRYKKIGIKISGGLDSAILCYMLCKYVAEEKQDGIIYPITIEKEIKPFHLKFARDIVKFCKREFPYVKFGRHLMYKQKDHETDHDTTQHIVLTTLIINKIIDCHFVGITKNPPMDIIFYDENGEEHTPPHERDDDGTIRQTSIRSHIGDYISYRPFVNINKKGIQELYAKFGLLKTLAVETRSCESRCPIKTNKFTTHCGKCWDCAERLWGFTMWKNKYDLGEV